MPNLKLWKSEELRRLRHESDRLFNRLCSDFGLPSVCHSLLAPTMRMTDAQDAITVELDLPGFTPQDFDITINNMQLTVRCTRQEACEEGTTQEQAYETSLTIPCKLRTEDVEAAYNAGVLRIIMPKCRRPATRRVPVTSAPSE